MCKIVKKAPSLFQGKVASSALADEMSSISGGAPSEEGEENKESCEKICFPNEQENYVRLLKRSSFPFFKGRWLHQPLADEDGRVSTEPETK